MKKILIKFSGVFFVVIITVILFLLYYLWGPSLGLMEPAEKFRVLCTIFAVPVFLSLLLVSRYSLVAFASRLRFFRKLNDKQNTWSNNSAHLKQVDISKKIINEVQQVLRHTYGHFWHSKVRILLMTGSVSDVEQLAPKLTRELWQEDRGTVLLWGGDPATPADADWLAALRKLRRRAVDGMVWVTSALDGMPATENSATSGLTPDAMDSVSHALKLRYEALGWKLPLYVWSLHPRAGEQAGRVTQPVGCLLPANCSPQTLAGQLTGLIPQLTAQGIQQVCGQPQHNFLLALADQLTRKPETVTEPLSVLLNPYRPQPLAGVVFSAPSAEAGRSISHHWGRDNRWDILPDRMTELPAGLRPRKQGVDWMRGMSVAAAALMLFWAASPTASWLRPHSSRCSRPRRENSRWPYACMRSPRYRKRFLNWNTARSTARRGMPALASVRTMTCWRRCFRATERGRSRCCAMRRRVIWKSSSPPSYSCRRTARCVRR